MGRLARCFKRRSDSVPIFRPLASATAVERSVLGKTVRAPALVSVTWTREVLKYCLEMMARFLVAAEPPILIERCEERTPAALPAFFILHLARRFIGPLRYVELLSGQIRPTVGYDCVLITVHLRSPPPNPGPCSIPTAILGRPRDRLPFSFREPGHRVSREESSVMAAHQL